MNWLYFLAADAVGLGPAEPVFNIWVHYGFTGLYVAVSLIAIMYLSSQVRDLQKQNSKQYSDMLEKVVTTVSQMNELQRQTNVVLVEVKDACQKSANATNEVRMYVDTLTQMVMRRMP